MKNKYVVIKQTDDATIEKVRIFSDFKHLRAYICQQLEEAFEFESQLEQNLPQSKAIIQSLASRKRELVLWTNAKSIHDLTDPDSALFTRAGLIFACCENHNDEIEIGGATNDE